MKSFNPIGWCHFTVNFWWGCAKVSPACAHCYAESLSNLRGKGRSTWGNDGKRWIRTEAALKELRSYNATARRNNTRYQVFINSMSDTFEDRRDLDAPRAALFTIVEELTNLDLLLLTKRPENVFKLTTPNIWNALGTGYWSPNLWIGATVENQEMLDRRFNELAKIPAAVKFLSAEPLLGPLDLSALAAWRDNLWVICGGESGPQARPMHPAWARSLRDQCAAMGVPFYFKQWGEWLPLNQFDNEDAATSCEEAEVAKNHFWGGTWPLNPERGDCRRLGKKSAGRLLDGIEHNGFPQVESGVQS